MPRKTNNAKKEQILEAARYLLSNEGMPAFNIDNIASYVGCAPSSIYRYFSGKDQILREALRQIRLHQLDLVREALAQTENPLQRINILLRRLVRAAAQGDCMPAIYHSRAFIREHPDLFREINTIISQSDLNIESGTSNIDLGISMLVNRLAKEASQARLLRPEVSTEVVTFMFFSCVHAVKVLCAVSTLEDSVRLAIDSWNQFLSGIKA